MHARAAANPKSRMPIRPTRAVRAGRLFLALVLLLVTACSGQDPVAKASADFKAGKNRHAEIQLKQVLRDEPDNGQAWLLLGRVSLAASHFADAAEQFRRAREQGVPTQELAVPMARALNASGSYKQTLALLASIPADSATVERARILSLQGRAYIGLGQTDKAAVAFRKALENKPDFAPALVGRAKLAEIAGDKARAERILEDTLERHPDNALALDTLGKLAYRNGRCDQATPLLKQMLALDESSLSLPRRFLGRAYLAECQMRAKQYEAAAKNTATLMKQSPGNAYANYLQARIDIRNKNYQDATADLQRLLKVAPGNVQGLMLLAQVKLARDNTKLAKVYLRKALENDPGRVAAVRMLAGLYLRDDQPGRAVDVLKRAYEDKPDDADIRAMLADATARTGDMQTALGYINDGKAGEVDPVLRMDLARRVAEAGDTNAALALLEQLGNSDETQRLQAQRLRISLYLQQDENERAVALAKALSDKAPNDVGRLRLLGGTYIAVGRTAQARKIFERALAAQPDSLATYFSLGLLALREKHYDAAQQRFEQILERDPDNTRARVSLGEALARQGQTQAAIEQLQQALANDPENTSVGSALIRAYLATKQAPKAVAIANKLTSAHPRNASIRRLEGVTLLAAGQSQAALKSLTRAARLAPQAPSYRLDLARAYLRLNEPEAALKHLKQLRKAFPEFLAAIPPLAMLQARRGDYKAAFDTVSVLPSGGETGWSAASLRGDIHMVKGDYAAAAKTYGSAYDARPARSLALKLSTARQKAGITPVPRPLTAWLDTHPRDTAMRFTLARWYKHDGELEKAARQYRAVLQNDPRNAAALNNLALVYADQADKRALATAKQAFEASSSQNPAITDTYGWLLVRNGQTQKGLSLLNKAAKARPDQPGIQYHLAAALARSGKRDDRVDARTLLRGILDSKQAFDERPAAKKLLQQLDEQPQKQAG